MSAHLTHRRAVGLMLLVGITAKVGQLAMTRAFRDLPVAEAR